LSDRADSILIGAQAIMNKETGEQLRSMLGIIGMSARGRVPA